MRYNLHGMKMYLVSNKKVRKLPQKVPVLTGFIPNSLTTSNVLSHGDLKKFETIDWGVKTVQKKCISRKCQGCKDEEWRCKLNPCEVHRKRLNRSQCLVQQQSYQSYKYNNNNNNNLLLIRRKYLYEYIQMRLTSYIKIIIK